MFLFRWFCNWILALALDTILINIETFVVVVGWLVGRCHFYHETVWFNSKRQLIIFRLRFSFVLPFFSFHFFSCFTLCTQVQCSRSIMLWNNSRNVVYTLFCFVSAVNFARGAMHFFSSHTHTHIHTLVYTYNRAFTDTNRFCGPAKCIMGPVIIAVMIKNTEKLYWWQYKI